MPCDSRDDVGDAGIEQQLNLVLELQLLLLESRDRQHVLVVAGHAHGDLVMKPAVFGPQGFEPGGGLIVVGHFRENAQSEWFTGLVTANRRNSAASGAIWAGQTPTFMVFSYGCHTIEKE